ncbi:PepSY-associated TM helix domain-containing protein [Pseudomonas sp. 5P_3.1_Bac2]|uniref:PepSY-associated TM helix domain-containing protein n=1 Tax=Pseudomonas sp. 5P_3.1_Bac2 TaxID=2971617 RepID=UPI0021C9305C|nr:PepSY-associated TM helix domain-containing protein [Pseudomonas sp. 5P_3.1_Bac2]MCU1718108.1 PepSY domain-containing protein [Pseudomonas sp. 5P_3.1_Bac2]
MFATFRHSMTWLHTWLGLVLGFVLMVAFFFGALSVFDREIDRWAVPETRFEPQPLPSFDKQLRPIYDKLKPQPVDYAATQQRVIGDLPPAQTLPMVSLYAYTTHRDPLLQIGGEYAVPNKLKDQSDDHAHVHGWETVDPRTGDFLQSNKLNIGTAWFFPMHYHLNWSWMALGYWVVALASLCMLVALVSGVVIHRKVFREFFTFRPWKRPQRSALDLHNLTGVVALPFHFFFAFTGLVIFAGALYFPVSHTLLQPLHKQHEVSEAEHTGLPHEPAGVYAPLASVDAMVAEAKRRWAQRDMPGDVGLLTIEHWQDANGYVSLYRAGSDRVALVGQAIHFKASTGEVLREDPDPSAVGSINEFLTGLHLQHFEHWLLRWLYLLGGLLGCVCIATGFIFFVEKRKRKHAELGGQGSRIVDALAVTFVTGMLIATLAMLTVNRLLAPELAAKADWEKMSFWLSWGVALLHAFWRSAPVAQARFNPAWREQCWIVAGLALAAVGLNWIGTGDHLLKTLFTQPYWPVAGVDLSLIASAAVALYAARKLARHSWVAAPSTAEVAHG